MNPCPSPELLERAFKTLLLDEGEDNAVVAHVETCGYCQSRLEALIAVDAPTLVGWNPNAVWDAHPSHQHQTTDFCHGVSCLSDQTAGPITEAPLPHIPGYQILSRLGQGGMGVVYKARHEKLNRVVALKMIRAGEHADIDRLARFQVEAEAVARLRHPNLVEIYDLGMTNGLPYFVLEYLPGGSLKQLFQQGPQPPQRSAELLAALAQAVHTAHQAGIVHRDLKPANVLLAEDGTPKITDFGLAKRREAPGQTQSGQIIGTPEYMAPEQARGDSKSVGPAADVYGLGAILYEALTGQPPFQSDEVMQTLQQVLSDDPVPPRRRVAEVPPDLETVCLKALRKEPKDRYATAQEFADELDRFLHDEPIRARPRSRLEKVCGWVRRKPTLAGLLAVTTGLMLMAGLAILLGIFQVQLQIEHERTEKALAAEWAANRKEQRLLYVNDIYGANWLYHENQVHRARQLLEDCNGEQRGWEWRYLDRITNADFYSLTGHVQPVHTLAFAPKRRWLVSGSGDGSLVFWDSVRAKRLLEVPCGSGPIWGAAFSPDGTRLACVSGSIREAGQLIVWELGSGSSVNLREVKRIGLENCLGKQSALAYHPSKDVLAVATGLRRGKSGCLLLLDADGRELRRWTGSVNQGCVAVAWAPDGRRLAASFLSIQQPGAKGEVIVVDPDQLEPLYRFEANGGRARALAFSTDGLTFASAGCDRFIELRDVGTFTLRKMCCGHAGPISSLAFTTAGQLVSGSWDTTVRVWNGRSGEELVVHRGHYGPVRCVAVQPETGLIYSGSDDITIKAWRAEQPQEASAHPLHKGAATALAFSPAGDALISVGLDGAIWRIDPTGVQKPRLLRQGVRPLRQVRFLPQSQTLLVAGGDEEAKRPDGIIQLLDASDGRLMGELDTQLQQVISLSVSSDGRRLSVVGRTRQHHGIVQIWDMTATPPCCRTIASELLPGDAIASQLYSGGDKLLVLLASGNNFLKPSFVLIDLSENPRLLPNPRHAISNPRFAVFTKDESLLFLGGRDRGFSKMKVSPNGLMHLARYSGHGGAIHKGALSPDERLFATASEDETIRVWDRQTDRELLVLRGDASAMKDVAFSPCGDFLAAVQASGVVRVWDGRAR